nr:immunoglobulin heavy chain junction region [Macaca mulatta]
CAKDVSNEYSNFRPFDYW